MRAPAARAKWKLPPRFVAPRLRQRPPSWQTPGSATQRHGRPGRQVAHRIFAARFATVSPSCSLRSWRWRPAQDAARAATRTPDTCPSVALVRLHECRQIDLDALRSPAAVLVCNKLLPLDTTVRTLQPESVPRVLRQRLQSASSEPAARTGGVIQINGEEALDASRCSCMSSTPAIRVRAPAAVTDHVLKEIGADAVPASSYSTKIDRWGGRRTSRVRSQFLRARTRCVVLTRRPDDVLKLRRKIAAGSRQRRTVPPLVSATDSRRNLLPTARFWTNAQMAEGRLPRPRRQTLFTVESAQEILPGTCETRRGLMTNQLTPRNIHRTRYAI